MYATRVGTVGVSRGPSSLVKHPAVSAGVARACGVLMSDMCVPIDGNLCVFWSVSLLSVLCPFVPRAGCGMWLYFIVVSPGRVIGTAIGT